MIYGDFAETVIELAKLIPDLKKTTYNRNANFNYVSIDDYYATVATILHENGVTWTIDEVGFELIRANGEDWVRFTYELNFYKAGDGWQDTVLKQTFSVIHPFQGAQTTGSAMSYAEKSVLRTVFKIVTGEPDADAFARGNGKGVRPATADTDDFDEPVKPREEPPGKEDPPPVNQAAKRAESVSSPKSKDEKKQTARQILEAAVASKTAERKQIVEANPEAGADKPEEAEDADGEYAASCDALVKAIAKIKDKPSLREWRQDVDNAKAIEDIKNYAPAQFLRLNSTFKSKLESFAQKKEEE